MTDNTRDDLVQQLETERGEWERQGKPAFVRFIVRVRDPFPHEKKGFFVQVAGLHFAAKTNDELAAELMDLVAPHRLGAGDVQLPWERAEMQNS